MVLKNSLFLLLYCSFLSTIAIHEGSKSGQNKKSSICGNVKRGKTVSGKALVFIEFCIKSQGTVH